MRYLAVLAASALTACVSVAPQPGGAVLHYLRTNGDGTEPERIVVHVASPTRVEVFKAKSRCTNAAFVTAELDAAGQARRLVGGRLTRQLTQEPLAWLDDEGGTLVARLGERGVEPTAHVQVADRWILFDFDFADLAAGRRETMRDGRAMSFDLPLVLAGDRGFEFRNLGVLELLPAGRNSEHVLYRARGTALGGSEGGFMFRAADGLLLEARLPIPNHAEYRDFRLRLVDEQHGAQAWRAVLADHWAGCPAGE